MKSLLYLVGSVFVSVWCVVSLSNGFTTGVLELPSSRASPGHDFASSASQPLAYWAGVAMWSVILAISLIVVITSIKTIFTKLRGF